MSIQLNINGQSLSLDIEPETPLLWVLRDELGLTGTKFGCGVASCGACTVTVDGVATRSCVMPISALQGTKIRSIEAEPDRITAALQAAWIELQVPQCGYCQSGMIMAAAALLRRHAQAQRRRHRRGHQQPLPLRHLPAHSRGHPSGSRPAARE